MSIRIPLDARALARSHFACSPAVEVVGALRGRDHARLAPTGDVTHPARWHERATARMDARQLGLLHALVPTDHPYTPDFLTPRPHGTDAGVEAIVEAIATTPAEVVEHHLDIALEGRAVRPDVLAQFESLEAYLAWRRPMPPMLADLVRQGPRSVAEGAAAAIAAFFAAGLAEDWSRVRAVLAGDIATRAERISAGGWTSLFADLRDVAWTGAGLELPRPFDGSIDWPFEGILFVPSTSHVGPVLFCAEEPEDPVMIYPALGVGALWSRERPGQPGADAEKPPRRTGIDEAIGTGRRAILDQLDRPRTTRDLSRIDGRSEATISYHLGVLARAGLVTRRRSGRSVSYRRTALADSLVGVRAEREHPGTATAPSLSGRGT